MFYPKSMNEKFELGDEDSVAAISSRLIPNLVLQKDTESILSPFVPKSQWQGVQSLNMVLPSLRSVFHNSKSQVGDSITGEHEYSSNFEDSEHHDKSNPRK